MANSNDVPAPSGDQVQHSLDDTVEKQDEISPAKLHVGRKEADSLMSSGDSRLL